MEKYMIDYISDFHKEIESPTDFDVLILALYDYNFNLDDEKTVQDFLDSLKGLRKKALFIDVKEGIDGLRTEEELTKFYKEHIEEINQKLFNEMEEYKFKSIYQIFGEDVWDFSDPLILGMTNITFILDFIVGRALDEGIDKLKRVLERNQ